MMPKQWNVRKKKDTVFGIEDRSATPRVYFLSCF